MIFYLYSELYHQLNWKHCLLNSFTALLKSGSFLLLQSYRLVHYSRYPFFHLDVEYPLHWWIQKTFFCEGTICTCAWTDTPDFVSLINIFLFLLCRSEMLTNLNRSEFPSSFSRLAPTMLSNVFHLLLRFWRTSTSMLYKYVHSPW